MKETKSNKKQTTKGELVKSIKSSVVFVPKDRNTISVYFDDKGLRLTATDDYAIISTGAHQHVFDKVTATGYSRPYIYTRRFIELALSNNCITKDSKGKTTRSYAMLMAILKEKEDKTDFNIAWYTDLWFNNIFVPLYSIDENTASSFVVYEQYLHNIARQQVILEEHTEDVTTHQFVEKIMENEKKYIDGMNDSVLFVKKTDEEVVQENIDAMQEEIQNSIISQPLEDGTKQ